jgi:hypothetical protein
MDAAPAKSFSDLFRAAFIIHKKANPDESDPQKKIP